MLALRELLVLGLVLPLYQVSARTVPHPSVFRRVERSHPETRTLLFDPTCKLIQSSITSASAVYAPGTIQYIQDMEHWSSSGEQHAACSVEPGTAADVSTVMKIISNSTSKFAIKGGGHSLNAGFSSTTGVLIDMSRYTSAPAWYQMTFSEITVHSDSQTVDLGPGLIWDDVYAKLVPMGINVVGGRVTGVGVPGFTLGGGFSWLTNLYGLTIDTAVGFEIVIPSGDILEVNAQQNADLFWGMKGGLNNFGVVTKITLKTFPQTDVWGGDIIYDGLYYDQLTTLSAAFQANNTDPNANVLPTYDILAGVQIFSLSVFYNKPTPPPGLFDAFLAIPALSTNIKTRSFGDLVTSAPSNSTAGLRGTFSSISLQTLSPSILKVVEQQAVYYGTVALLGAGIFVSYDVEPFLTSWVSHSTDSAWPHSNYLSPLNLYFAWPLGLSDDIFYKAIADSKAAIIKAAEAEGQDLSQLYTYPNYALATDSLESIYGPNVPKLKTLAAKYDPAKVMTRTGGFIFQA